MTLILDGFLRARANLARRLTKAGWFPIAGKSVFAAPSGVIGDVGSTQILWGGKEDICATGQAGTGASYGIVALKG